MSTEEKGKVDILNTGEGHLTIRFNPDNPMESDRAKRCIQDMIKRGYAIFAEGAEGKFSRVKEFDEKRAVYIIDHVPYEGDDADPFPEAPATTRRGRKVRELPAGETNVTAVGRSAGG